MYFDTKSYLKSNHNYTTKHTLYRDRVGRVNYHYLQGNYYQLLLEGQYKKH
jgi:hypothetical protein